jgi:hypothetical protein
MPWSVKRPTAVAYVNITSIADLVEQPCPQARRSTSRRSE